MSFKFKGKSFYLFSSWDDENQIQYAGEALDEPDYHHYVTVNKGNLGRTKLHAAYLVQDNHYEEALEIVRKRAELKKKFDDSMKLVYNFRDRIFNEAE